jgi:hypothetical protein
MPPPTPLPPTATAVAPESEAVESEVLTSGEVVRIGDDGWISQEGGEAAEARQANAALILDASGSMNAALSGAGKSKLAVAKEVMAQLVPEIPADVHGALWIYGHRYPQDPKSKSCTDIERVYALGPVDATAYMAAVNAAKAIGYTPISDSIAQAAKDLPAGDYNSIILVSDGEETCGGDPCALAEALKAGDAQVTIHVVGYAVEQVARDQLECIASVSGGTYHDAEDAEGLLEALQQALGAAATATILRVETLGPDGEQVHTNPRLYEPGGDQMVSGHIAWVDNAVTPGTYDLWVDTLPRIVYRNLELPEGSTTVARIPLGALHPLAADGTETSVDVYEASSGKRVGRYGETILLVPGAYQVSENGSTSGPLAVEAGEITDFQLGALRPLAPDGEETSVDVYDADSGQRLGRYGGAILLVPGAYQVSENGTTSAAISVEGGEVTDFRLGAIRPLTADGAEMPVDVYDAATGKRLGRYGGTILLAPGAYRLVLDDGTTRENVVVQAGEVTTVK